MNLRGSMCALLVAACQRAFRSITTGDGGVEGKRNQSAPSAAAPCGPLQLPLQMRPLPPAAAAAWARAVPVAQAASFAVLLQRLPLHQQLVPETPGQKSSPCPLTYLIQALMPSGSPSPVQSVKKEAAAWMRWPAGPCSGQSGAAPPGRSTGCKTDGQQHERWRCTP